MNDIPSTNSFATTPKDGFWYKIPGLAPELTEFIRWDKDSNRWNWIMLKDDVAVVETAYVLEKN